MKLTKPDHDAWLLCGPLGPRPTVELANVLGPGVLRACNELLAELDKDIEGCTEERLLSFASSLSACR